jgi:hypothetical protein
MSLRIRPVQLAILGLSVVVNGFAADAPPREKGPEPSGRTFDALDKDDDGKISAEEARSDATLAKLFTGLDANKDGFVSRTEFAAYDPANAANLGK